jgi:hypothetical protein
MVISLKGDVRDDCGAMSDEVRAFMKDTTSTVSSTRPRGEDGA